MRPLESKNRVLFIILVIVVVIIITMFVVFMSIFNSFDKNEYDTAENSVLFDKDYNYVKVLGDAKLKQNYDGLYYLYEKKDNKSYKYKIGKTAIVHKDNDNYIYLYGKAYQVQATGDVIALTSENKVVKSSPTKFFKLADRKYLMVDSSIKSLNDNIINTKGYLIIELDKNGNATFANNELNFKAIKPMVLTGSTFNFDIANEKIIYNDNVIDLKNIIGSSNQYKKGNGKNSVDNGNSEISGDANGGNGSTGGSGGYYDNYLNEVINSVNNLTGSVEKTNKNNSKIQINAGGSAYYDFDKWIVLKNVSTQVSNIVLSYQVFDPNSEYQAVFAKVEDRASGVSNLIYVNKNNTEYTIRNLLPDREYKISFGYQTNKSQDLVVVDEVTVKTTKPSYKIKVDKIVEKYVNDDTSTQSQYSIYYTVSVDKSYVMQSGDIVYYSDGLVKRTEHITKAMLNDNKQYSGVITLPLSTPLGTINTLKLERLEVCDGDENNNCNSNIDINTVYNFYGE